jgi:glycosyltransferase involved in cell wall biosynthesis
VSIVLPVYNGAQFLEQCLRSIAKQTHRPLEVAVCDNGSTDATPRILAEFQPKLEAAGIRYVCVTTGATDPRGCGYARNRCIEAASGAEAL